MSLDTATDYHVVKREWSIEFDGTTFTTSFADDHWRLRIYLLGNSGGETLVFETDPFDYFPKTIDFIDPPSVPTTDDFAPVDGEFYRVEAVAFDGGESAEEVEEEWFIYARPDEIVTQGVLVTTSGDPLPNAIDQAALDKLVKVLGGNILHGEFEDADGYTTRRVSRGYETLTASQAAALLATSDDPGEVDVTLKSVALVTTADNGNELATIEQEQAVS